MEIITTESLASTFVKNILKELWESYTDSVREFGKWITFDQFVYRHLSEFGFVVYEQIGQKYGDLDAAIDEVMK